MAQPSNTFSSILQNHFKQSSPLSVYDDANIINNLRQAVAPKQTLVTDSLNLDEYLAELEDSSPEHVRRRWESGLSLVSWQPEPGDFTGTRRELTTLVQCGHLQVSWKEVIFDIVKYALADNHPFQHTREYYVLIFEGETDSVGRDFVREVCAWDDRREHHMMLVFDGSWKSDRSLASTVRNATWEDLVLDGEMIDSLKRDVTTFFRSRKLYQDLGVPWKRGLLFIGPPGNGKSFTIKILVSESRVPCLYVKSAAGRLGDRPEDMIMQIFKKARTLAPCVLVLEDLDSLLQKDLRAYFLNEVDGFANNNDGILILASSNHPEDIDSAILNRPSRFDDKYSFELPTNILRREYAEKWLAKVVAHNVNGVHIKFQDHKVLAEKIANETEGFSYAYMKELFLSFLLSVANARSSGGISNQSEALLLKQTVALKKQIKIGLNEAEKKDKDQAGSTQKSTKSRAALFMKFFRQ